VIPQWYGLLQLRGTRLSRPLTSSLVKCLGLPKLVSSLRVANSMLMKQQRWARKQVSPSPDAEFCTGTRQSSQTEQAGGLAINQQKHGAQGCVILYGIVEGAGATNKLA